MPKTSALYITQSTAMASDLKDLLAQDDIILQQTENWEKALSLCNNAPPHLIILDCDGWGVDALFFCPKIRASYKGLLVLISGFDNDQFHIFALNTGADASFPFTTEAPLIAANINALLRRFGSVKPPKVLTFGSLTVDASKRDVFVAGQAAQLSTVEFSLFWSLAQKPGCVVGRAQLYRELHNTDYNKYDRSIDVYMSRIRQKIGDHPASPHYLKTVRGVGYQFMNDDEPACSGVKGTPSSQQVT